ncbi:MAG: type 12 methyltransferase [Myxococcaceae bacterium]|nr:type 12 methyltransferase [Myxococcaceae bacterium]
MSAPGEFRTNLEPLTSALPEEWLGSRLSRRKLTLCPELSLWLLGDDVDLHQRVSEVFAIETAPYWAFCWGSGQALARYVLDHPELVTGLDVVDFGAGCGVAAIAALRAGARSAVAVDIDAHALEACQRNAALNQVQLTTARELPERYDVLLASDVLYELGNRDFLRAEASRGRRIIVSDPLRRDNPRLDLVPCCRYDVTAMPDVDYPVASAVIYQL